MKGSDVDEEHRLVLISGYFADVIKAFDLISELMQQASINHSASSLDVGLHNNFAMHVLLEHSKAGKAVGAKGATMQTIKNNSSVNNLRIEKEPKVW